jgi:hypothetical protein
VLVLPYSNAYSSEEFYVELLVLHLYQGQKLGSWIYVLRRFHTEELLKRTKSKTWCSKTISLSILSAGAQSLSLLPTYMRSGTTYIEYEFVSAKRLHSNHVRQKISLKRTVINHLKSGIYYAAIGEDIQSAT